MFGDVFTPHKVVIYTRVGGGYMKTLIDVDDEALAAAMQALGTTTKVATVNEALRAVARHHREALPRHPMALFDWAQDRSRSALTDPEVMLGAWA